MNRANTKLVVVIKYAAPYMAALFRAINNELGKNNVDFSVIVGSTTINNSFGDSKDWMHGFSYKTLDLDILPLTPRDKRLIPPHPRLFKVIKEEKPDILWVHERNPFAIGAILWAKINDIPVIISSDVGDCPPNYASSFFHRIYRKFTYRLHNGSIAMTMDAFRVADILQRPKVFIPHAVSSNDFKNQYTHKSSNPFRFLFVGTLDQRKGFDALILASIRLFELRKDFEVRVVGCGPLASQFEQNNYQWLSYAGKLPHKELFNEYEQADAFIFPSRQDTYAVVVHEAACFGLPLIVGKGAGASEVLVKSYMNGIVVDPNNIEDIFNAMHFMLENPVELQKMRRISRELAINFGVESNSVNFSNWFLTHFSL